jgi:predicted DNA-binding transcriptional regulator AlpA
MRGWKGSSPVSSSTKSPSQSYCDLASADKKHGLKSSAAAIAPEADRADGDDPDDPDHPDIDNAREQAKPKPARFIHRAEVLNRVGVSYTALWFWIRDGRFPAPRELGGSHQRSKLAWLESEVDEWMASRPKRLPKGSKARAEVA